jgi:hypothetical protein
LNKEQLGWRIIPESAENSPRAPWWYQAESKKRFRKFSLNPTAEILGYLYDYPHQVPARILALVKTQVPSELESLNEIEIHQLICCVRLLQTPLLPEEYQQQVFLRVRELIDRTVSRDPTHQFRASTKQSS